MIREHVNIYKTQYYSPSGDELLVIGLMVIKEIFQMTQFPHLTSALSLTPEGSNIYNLGLQAGGININGNLVWRHVCAFDKHGVKHQVSEAKQTSIIQSA